MWAFLPNLCQNFNKRESVKIYKIEPNNTFELFKKLDCDIAGAKIMAKKTEMHLLFIQDLHVGAANILKQDALSIGADLAVPNGVVIAKDKFVDAVLLGTTKHFEILSRKELSQPFGLKDLAGQLLQFTKKQTKTTKIMGVLNANSDSFWSHSRFDAIDASQKISQMIEEGADIIDIGAVSSRPGSDLVGKEEELKRIAPILETIKTNKFYENVIFSIDSYEPSVINYAFDCGFKIANDISGISNIEIANLCAKYDASLVIMHMQKNPKTMQEEPFYKNVITEIDDFFSEKIKIAKNAGVQDIVLDVGIGFGKTLEHNLNLLQNMSHFLHFGYELLIGASRKSMINAIFPTQTEERLPGTLAIHLDAVRKGATIVRCHDVKEHKQALAVQDAIVKFS